jgi:hypothetical protein
MKPVRASVIQTRHRIPEHPLRDDQIMVYQVPIPEPLRWLEPRENETRKMHALEEYGVMHVRLYEDISQHGRIATNYSYPVLVDGRYIMSPSPIPKFDNPKLHQSPALHLLGAGREKRIYAVPPYTDVKSLDFEDLSLHGADLGRILRAVRGRRHLLWMRSSWTTRVPACSSAPIPFIAPSGARRATWAPMPTRAGDFEVEVEE